MSVLSINIRIGCSTADGTKTGPERLSLPARVLLAMFPLLVPVFAALLILLSVEKYLSLRSVSRAFGVCPNAGVLLLRPMSPLAILSAQWFPLRHHVGSYFAKFTCYARYGSTCISSVTLWGSIPTVWLSDAQTIKTVAAESTIFQKDVEVYEPVNIYGPNVVGTEGVDWKRHRRIANPAFDEASNAFVWMETARVVNEWFTEMNSKAGSDCTITINAVEDLVQVTLLVVASAGFGRRASWHEDSSTKPPPGHKLAFRPALGLTVSRLFTRVLTPNWIYALSARVRLPLIGSALAETREAFDALRDHMLDLISLSRAWVVGGKISNMDAALLRNLVEANMTDTDNVLHKKLTDEELLSNVFLFFLAGHETSAHSLSFSVALLALYPDIQQKIYEETVKLWPNGCPPTASLSSYKECMPQLPYTLAAFQETLRLFPAAPRLVKIVQTDTDLTAHRFTTDPTGELQNITPFSVPLTKGSMVVIDIAALHMNPMYWGQDVENFKPERFIDTETYRWPRDAFFGFSGGTRSCVGQRFALAESVCALASLVRSYDISVPDHLGSKSFEEQKRLMLRWKLGVTSTPTNCVVRLRCRDT
ncbi:cytochrome P450 [Mycena latifolia]|nr:cytochrome P450 [Mycena latifolia]